MRRFKKWITIFCWIIFVGIIIYSGIYLYARFTPKLAINSANKFVFYDINGNTYNADTTDKWIKLEDISPYLVDATIAIEDKKFYRHHGFDFLRIVKSLYINFKNKGKLQGASTITQQYAKNLFLTFDKTWARKIEEAWLTIRLESHYSKDELLEGYLNTINYGGIFGIENASNYYFGKSASDLSLAEATILAGIPKNPGYYSPLANEKAAKNRQATILYAMEQNNYITEEERENASNEILTYLGNKNVNNNTTIMYYQDAVLDELYKIKTIPATFLETGGLKIYTYLDMNAQTILDNSIKKNMKDEDELQLASIVMDPQTGHILALAGGKNYATSQYNRATNSKRQFGSTMKPFLYYAALENGFTPSTKFTSEKTIFTFSNNQTYTPNNYNNTYPNKDITLATAIAYSDNIYAVKTHIFLGEDTLVDTAKRLGINAKLEAIPSLPLGTKEINIIDMTSAYATFANEGYKIEPRLISRVEDENGNILYQAEETKENVLNRGIVYVLNELLTCTYSKELVDYDYPTMINYAAQMTNKYAVKTGSTDYDRLIFGYNKDLIVGVWTGYDNNRRIESDKGKISKKIWIETMEGYLKDKNSEWYEMPNNVVGVLTDPVTGELATNDSKRKKIMYYIKGTEPRNDNISLDDVIPTIKEDE